MNLPINYVLFQVIFVGLPLIALLIPIIMYLFSGWVLRRNEILTSFTDEVVCQYFKAFFQTIYYKNLSTQKEAGFGTRKKVPSCEKVASDERELIVTELRRQFAKIFSRSFGRMKFIAPAMLLLVITGMLLFVWTEIARADLSLLSVSKPTGFVVALSGFCGGYMWVFYSLVKRMQERQLNPADLNWNCLRIIVSVPIAMAIASVCSNDLKIPVAFMLGAFPTHALMTFMRRTASSKLNMEKSFADPEMKLIELQGIDRDQAEIFSREGVGTILQLAYSDPVDLTMRTGFSFSYIVDCCSQALAWLTFEGRLKELRDYGLRGAQEVSTIVRELERNNPYNKEKLDEEEEWAKRTLAAISEKLQVEPVVLRRIFDDIAYDPYTQFLCNVWRSEWN